MRGTTDVHHKMTAALLPRADLVSDEATALNTAVGVDEECKSVLFRANSTRPALARAMGVGRLPDRETVRVDIRTR